MFEPAVTAGAVSYHRFELAQVPGGDHLENGIAGNNGRGWP
jgi:hypothetical protein